MSRKTIIVVIAAVLAVSAVWIVLVIALRAGVSHVIEADQKLTSGANDYSK